MLWKIFKYNCFFCVRKEKNGDLLIFDQLLRIYFYLFGTPTQYESFKTNRVDSVILTSKVLISYALDIWISYPIN